VKVLRPELAAVIGTERFLTEIRVTANLLHPNIVQLYDSGGTEGILYYVMPSVEGESLREKINRESQLAIDEAVKIAGTVADALDYAHRRDVIHRDIKPENILMHEGSPMVADFGIALAVSRGAGDRVTETGLSLGTPSYMSPEQATGDRNLDARTDVYALGSVLYEMLAGDPPFVGSNVQAVIAKVVGEKPMKLRTIRDTIPPNVEAAVHKALAKVPADRFESAGAFADALITTTPVTVVTPAAPSLDTSETSSWRRWASYVVPIGVVGIAVALALSAPGGDPADTGAASTTIRPLTRFAGWEMGPSWSPDGSIVAYSHIVGGSAEIATLPRGGGDPHLLTDNPADDVNPRFSPDGSKIAFLSDRGTGSDLFWISPTGGAERKLAETNIPFLERMHDWFGALGSNPWTPDGEELLFSKLHETGEVAIWKVNVSTREQTQITFPAPGTSDRWASFSHDGESVMFTRAGRAGAAVWQVPGGGGEAVPLIDDGPYNGQAAWSPDDRRVAFVSARGGALNLWELEVGSRELRQLTVGVGNDAQPVYGQDGTIAYANWNHEIDVYAMQVGAAEDEHERLTAFAGSHFGARASPDGNRVLYFADRTGSFDLWILDRTTGLHQQVAEHPATDKLADWSPDGDEIVFVSDRGNALGLWVVDVETGVVRLLTDHVLPLTLHPAEAGGPRWSPDGSTIGYIAPGDDGNAIWLVGPDGADPHPSIVRSALSFGWYRDNQRLVYTRRATDRSGTVELRVAHLATGEDRLLLAGAPSEVEVSPDGRALSFVESVSHFTMNLHILQLTPTSGPDELPGPLDGARQVTFGGGVWHVHNGGWGPDGNSIVYSRDRDYGDIYLLESNR
jgi:serine/threonine-protein kinase